MCIFKNWIKIPLLKEIFMKKIVILTLIFAGFTLSANAQSSFSTFTPFTPQQAYKFNSNLYDRYLPPNKQQRYLPPPPPPNSYNRYNQFGYYDPYYSQNQTKWQRFKNFFSSGQMTGYTPSYNSAFDNNPYGYQSGYYDSFGNYHQKNYDQQNGMSIKILD